jgi:hypothetical protein
MLRGENCTEMELQPSAGSEPQQWQTTCRCAYYRSMPKTFQLQHFGWVEKLQATVAIFP